MAVNIQSVAAHRTVVDRFSAVAKNAPKWGMATLTEQCFLCHRTWQRSSSARLTLHASMDTGFYLLLHRLLLISQDEGARLYDLECVLQRLKKRGRFVTMCRPDT